MRFYPSAKDGPDTKIGPTLGSTIPASCITSYFVTGRLLLFPALTAAFFLASEAVGTATAAELRPPGFRPLPPSSHALVGGTVWMNADSVVTNATILFRDGLITAVGTDLTIPADARVWNCVGQVIYPGFIEPRVVLGGANQTLAERHRDHRQAGADLTASGGPYFGVSTADRPAGTSALGDRLPSVTPERHVSETYVPPTKVLEDLRDQGFTAANFSPGTGIYRGWSSLFQLGDRKASESLIRADTDGQVALETQPDSAYPGSLMGVVTVVRQTALDARHALKTNPSGSVSGLPDRTANTSLKSMAPLLTNGAPTVVEAGSVLMESRIGQLQPELGFSLQFVAAGTEWRRPDLVARLVERGIPWIVPVDFPALPKFPSAEVWDEVELDRLRAWDWAPENPALLKRLHARIALTTYGLSDRKEFRNHLRAAIDHGLSEADAVAALTSEPASLCGVGDRLGSIAPGKLANFTLTTAPGYFADDAKVVGVWVAGEPYLQPPDTHSSKTNQPAKAEVAGKESAPAAKPDAKKEPDTKKELRELAAHRVAHDPRRGPTDDDRPETLLLTSVTIWTCGPAGILTNSSLLVSGGKIVALGSTNSFSIPVGTRQIDLPGLQISPGIIDCHSHSMILGGVNEATLPSTAMCRIGDVVNSEAATIHEQLAGGLTIANLLHGSANPIGGQNCVIKLREGVGPDELKLKGAPEGIKFALGENVKQSNWGERHTTRFPQSRLGVPVFYANRFTAARQYLAAWKAFNAKGGPEPRRDLELEALGEILEGKRLIHCHSYRQDEILAFLRTMESFGIRVGTLQHILEGYKVADEIARHGAGASSFADWWAYKYEVIDAIPYAGSLMRDRGVLVSFNSDSSDHARRLNLEAAKAVHYGGTPPEEALKFVTLNPAKQLGIDRWVGSLEPGKDADFAIWSGSPLDASSLCLQTWIDGIRYFDRSREVQRVKDLNDERTALVAKARKLAGEDAGGPAAKPATSAGEDRFYRVSLEQEHDHQIIDCLDVEVATH